MNEASDLRQRREALQVQLEALRAQRARASQTNSFARSRDRAGVADYAAADKKDFADQEVSGDAELIRIRQEIALIDGQLREQSGVGGAARRLTGRFRKS